MSTPVRTAKSDQTLEEIAHHFEAVSTLPVVDGNLICIGVISKNDQAKASHGVRSPPPSLPPSHTQKKKKKNLYAYLIKWLLGYQKLFMVCWQLQTRIGEMMSSPAITLSEDKTVMGKCSLQQFDLPLKISSKCTRIFFVSRVIK